MNRKRIATAIITLVLCANVFTLQAQQNPAGEFHSFSAQDAVNYALKNSVQVKNALLDIQAQRQQNKEITAAALPQITASGSATYNPNVAEVGS